MFRLDHDKRFQLQHATSPLDVTISTHGTFNMLLTCMFCLYMFTQGSERNRISITSMSFTYGKIDNKVDFDIKVRRCWGRGGALEDEAMEQDNIWKA